MILTIALNPTVNRRIQLDKFNMNGESIAKTDLLTVGDCGIYSAYVMKLLQGDSYVMGVSGGIGGRFIRNFLNKNRIKSDLLQIDRETMTKLIIDDGSKYDTTIVSHNDYLTNRDFINIRHKLYHHLDEAELIVITGNDENTIALIKDIHQVTNNTMRIVVGAEREALQVALTDKVFGIVLSEDDLKYLNLERPHSIESINDLLVFQKKHKIKYMVIQTIDYIYGFSQNKVCRVPWNTSIVNRTVSKSLMLGGLSICIKRKYPFERMLKLLGAIGMECNISEYPFVLKRKEVERQIKHIKIQEVYNLRNGFLIGDSDIE